MRPTPRLAESPLPFRPYIFIRLPARFINSLPRRLSIVLRTRIIRFKADHFSREIISYIYVSWGISLHDGGPFHMFRLIRPDQSEYAISKRGPHYMGV